jgi:hypothetical protein
MKNLKYYIRINYLFFIVIVIICCSCKRNKEEVITKTTIAIKNINKDDTYVISGEIINLSDQSIYIYHTGYFPLLSNFVFWDNNDTNISDKIEDELLHVMESYTPSYPPEDIFNYRNCESEIKQISFFEKALNLELSYFFKLNNLDSIPNHHKPLITELLGVKYNQFPYLSFPVVLIEAQGTYYWEYVFDPISIILFNDLKSIEFFYNYNTLLGDSSMNEDSIFTFSIDNVEYKMTNFPLDKVGNYHLFKGKLHDVIEFK